MKCALEMPIIYLKAIISLLMIYLAWNQIAHAEVINYYSQLFTHPAYTAMFRSGYVSIL